MGATSTRYSSTEIGLSRCAGLLHFCRPWIIRTWFFTIGLLMASFFLRFAKYSSGIASQLPVPLSLKNYHPPIHDKILGKSQQVSTCYTFRSLRWGLPSHRAWLCC